MPLYTLFAVLIFLWQPVPSFGVMPENIGAGQVLFTALDGQRSRAVHLESRAELKVSGLVVQVELTQYFVNRTDQWQEAVYVLPLSETAGVNAMEMVVGERVIRAEIKARAKAREIYQQAKSDGKKAALIEQNRPNLFTQSLANVGPGETMVVRLRYVDHVSFDNGEFSYRFPMTLTPRYMPGQLTEKVLSDDATGWSLPTNQVRDAHRVSPPMQQQSRDEKPLNPIEINVTLNPGMALQEIDSPYHQVSVSRQDTSYQVGLVQGAVSMDRDFVLRWQPVPGSQPRAAAFAEQIEGEDYLLLMLLPPASEATSNLPKDMVFVIDTSGSMQGTSIVQAKSGLLAALERLGPQDRFNIIAFNTGWSRLFNALQSPDPFNLHYAKNWVAQLTAGGGTEMLPALQQALASQGDEQRIKQIVFITDGAVGNETALLQLIVAQLGQTRLFPVGIGSAPNSHFMRQAAKHGRGTFTFIGSQQEVGAEIAALFEKIEQPVATDLSLVWPASAEVFPQKIPAVYRGEPLLIAAKVGELQGELLITGRTADQPFSQTLDLALSPASPGIGHIWARRKIDHLSDLKLYGEDEATIRQDIVDVALTHDLVTRYTSFVAVEDRVSRFNEDTLNTVPVANAVASGQLSHAGRYAAYPNTATRANLWFVLGLVTALLALLTIGLARRYQCPN